MAETEPTLAIVDLSLKPGRSGIDLIKEMAKRHPAVISVVLSMHDELFYAERSLRAGARSYVMKGEDPDELLTALRHVRKGGVHLSQEHQAALARRAATPDPGVPRSAVETLDERELEVFELVGRGQPTREIAKQLTVSVKTIETHRHRIRKKLGLDTQTQMLRYAIRWVERQASRLP